MKSKILNFISYFQYLSGFCGAVLPDSGSYSIEAVKIAERFDFYLNRDDF